MAGAVLSESYDSASESESDASVRGAVARYVDMAVDEMSPVSEEEIGEGSRPGPSGDAWTDPPMDRAVLAQFDPLSPEVEAEAEVEVPVAEGHGELRMEQVRARMEEFVFDQSR